MNQLVRFADSAKCVAEGLESRPVQVRTKGRAGILDDGDVEAPIGRVPGRGFNTHVRCHPAYQERGNSHIAERLVEHG